MPLFLVIFLNAFVDLGHKITIQNIVFKVHDGSAQVVLIAVINALILLPYIFLFLPAARFVDRNPKPKVMRITAWSSLLLVCLIVVSYRQGWFWLAFMMTFLMAVQSTFYSPAKLSFLKHLFGIADLTKANGIAQASAIAGILLGTLIFSIGFEHFFDASLIANNRLSTSENAKGVGLQQVSGLGVALFALAVMQLLLAYRIPSCASDKPKIALHRAQSGLTMIRRVTRTRHFFVPIAGLALFWSVGQGMLAVFPPYAKAYAGITNAAVVQAILAASTIGILVGAWLASKFADGVGRLETIPCGVFGLCLGLWSLLYWQSPLAFALVYFFMGLCSALFIVPLNAYLQWRADNQHIGSILVTSNLFQNIAMLAMLVLTVMFAVLILDVRALLYAIATIASLGGLSVLYLLRHLPRDGAGP